MGEAFEYCAPKYLDFKQKTPSRTSEFFGIRTSLCNMDTDVMEVDVLGQLTSDQQEDVHSEDDLYFSVRSEEDEQLSCEEEIMNVSREILESLISQVESLQVESNPRVVTFNIDNNTQTDGKAKTKRKTHGMLTRQDKTRTPTINLRSRSVVKAFSEKKNLYDKEKRGTHTVSRKLSLSGDETKRKGSDDINPPAKFLSMAEEVLKFQIATPKRFRTRSHTAEREKMPFTRPQPTIPVTPRLRAVSRTRPVTYVSREEEEAKIAEEMKKYQIKAQPLNPDVLKPPPPRVRVENKAATKPKPFNLTEVKPKVPPPAAQKFLFVAQPVPKAILTAPQGVPEKEKLPATQPKTPKLELKSRFPFEKRRTTEVFQFGKSPDNRRKAVPLKRCEVKPFSFEERDKEIKKKKEEKIKAVLDEEKRKREFHAHPIPQFVKLTNVTCVSAHNTTCASITSSASSKENQLVSPFKARPAIVLKKEPFRPRKDSRPLLEATNIVLHTELRRSERAKFEAAERERQKLQEEQLRELYKLEEQKKQEEIAELRRQAEAFKANPVRKFKHITVEKSSQPLTSPASPRFKKK